MTSALLRVDGVHKHRGGRRILDGFDLQVDRGERVVLLGENASGKSTVIGLVVGLLAPDRGSVTIAGVRLDIDRARALAHVGYVPDRPDFPGHLRVDEWLALVASLRRAAVPEGETLAPLRIEEVMRAPIRALSLGQKRRVAIASALVGHPRLLVLDEPTNGLDAAALASVTEALQAHAASDGALLCATHDAGFAAAIASRTVRLP